MVWAQTAGFLPHRALFWPFQKNRKIAKLGREIEVAGGSEVAQVFYGWGTRSLLSGLGSNGARDERGFSGALGAQVTETTTLSSVCGGRNE